MRPGWTEKIIERTGNSERERLDWLRLYRSENVGPASFFRLIEEFGSASRALEALPELARRGGKRQIRLYPRDKAEAELAALDRLGAQLLLATESLFPVGLSHLQLCPLLTLRGDVRLLARPGIAVVGAREASIAGRKIAHGLAADLGEAGFCVISGMARGIDSAAHLGGLASATIAVLAGGVDIVYPRENQRLYEQIVEQGCVVSEMPPGFQPTAAHFPRRNRLIAGLAIATVVVEAHLRSGSLITARFALEQGRDVFAVPGSPLEPRALGPNSLIKQGAALVESAADIIAGVTLTPPAPLIRAEPKVQIDDNSLSSAHQKVERCLSVTAVTVDEILRQCQFSSATLSLVLLELELAGRLQRHPDQTVSLKT